MSVAVQPTASSPISSETMLQSFMELLEKSILADAEQAAKMLCDSSALVTAWENEFLVGKSSPEALGAHRNMVETHLRIGHLLRGILDHNEVREMPIHRQLDAAISRLENKLDLWHSERGTEEDRRNILHQVFNVA